MCFRCLVRLSWVICITEALCLDDMKLSLECDVEGNTLLGGSEEIRHEGARYIFESDGLGFLAKVRIIKPIEHPERFYSVFNKGESDQVEVLQVRSDGELFDSTIAEFQQLESMLAFSVDIKKVHWESPSYSLIPENDEEQKRIQFFGARVKRGKRPPDKLTRGELQAIVTARERLQYLTVIQAFWREGRNAFDDQQYISAFSQFYHILEDRYAPGASDKNVVRRKFQDSAELVGFIEGIIKANTAIPPPHHNQVLDMLARRLKQFDVRGLIHLITETRGEVYHFVDNSRRAYANPFRNGQYAGLALLMLILTRMIIHQRTVGAKDSGTH